MLVELEGGCRVSSLDAGEARREGTLEVRHLFGAEQGTKAISLRTLRCEQGPSPAWRNPDCDEVLFVLEGTGAVRLDGHGHRVSSATGVHVAPGVVCALQDDGEGPLLLLSARCPEPKGPDVFETAPTSPEHAHLAPPIARLADLSAQETGDRWYKVLVGDKIGSAQVTQFVGSIPPGRAPDHFHHYEEVLCILQGTGLMWAGETHAPIRPGSCVYLPRGQVHCVENTGDGDLRLLGVFYPAGSPAVRYDA